MSISCEAATLHSSKVKTFSKTYAEYYRSKRYHGGPGYCYNKIMSAVLLICKAGKVDNLICASFCVLDPKQKHAFFFEKIYPLLEKHHFPIPGSDRMDLALEEFRVSVLGT
ncbi:hypothetical protein ACI2KR_06865 [Pseudomonas luteola]